MTTQNIDKISNYKYNNAKRSIPAHLTFVNDTHHDLQFWTVTSKIVLGSQLISLRVHCDLDLWPLTYKINRVHPLTMVNISAKFDEEIHNGLVAIMFTSLFPYNYVHYDLDLWPPKSIGSILSPWLRCLLSLIKKIHNGLVCMVFTSLFPYMSIVTLTFDLQNQ